MKSIYILTENSIAIEEIKSGFSDDFIFVTCSDYDKLISEFNKQVPEFIFIDIIYLNPPATIQEKLQSFWEKSVDIEIILLTAPENIRVTVQALKSGASDYLTYPVKSVEVKYIIENIRNEIRLHSELKYLRNRLLNQEVSPSFRTKSLKMQETIERLRTVAASETTVLLLGESGVGKNVFATFIHLHSQRSKSQFISLHCGAIPDTLLESELFGHEKGAFTGAIRKKLGKFELAHNGTLFLDEIGTISSSMQIKLLQFLQDRTLQRVGGEVNLKVNVRIIAATNANLDQLVQENKFREDLYYRLNVFPIEIPPLRERLVDIPILVQAILDKLNQFSIKSITSIDDDVIQSLQNYYWPGNIRELENVIERAYVLEPSDCLTRSSFPPDLLQDPDLYLPDSGHEYRLEDVRRKAVESAEFHYLSNLLKLNHGKINESALAAGIGVRQLHKLLKKHHLKKEDFK